MCQDANSNVYAARLPEFQEQKTLNTDQIFVLIKLSCFSSFGYFLMVSNKYTLRVFYELSRCVKASVNKFF